MKRSLKAGAVLLAAAFSLPLLAGSAAAHPLGNFTVNHYTGLIVQPDKVVLDLVVDTAEIPTFRRRSDIDTNKDRTIDAAERTAFGAAECARQVGRLDLRIDGRLAALGITSSALEFLPGGAGLDTMRLGCTVESKVRISARGSAIALSERAPDGRIGWREMTAQGDGVTLSGATVPAESLSKRLTVYPKNLLQSPLDVTSASAIARPGGARLAAGIAAARRTSPLSRGVDGATAAFQNFVGRRQLTPLIGLAAFVLAVILGAVHALAPGHGKTVMAAFIVGERGSLRQAWLIGLTVTVTHTAGVLVLGIILTVTDLAAPNRVYGALGLASGLMLGSVGVVLLTRALRQRAHQRSMATSVIVADANAPALVSAGGGAHEQTHAAAHEHGHDHGHDHGHAHGHEAAQGHAHEDDHGGNASHRHGLFSHRHVVPAGDRPLGLRSIVAMGFAGGLVPSPSALVVLLGAVALGRTWFGVLLVVAYGAGMAATLTGTGLVLSRASARLGAGAASYGPRMRRAMSVAKLLPFVTAGVVLTVGTVIAFQGLRAAL